MALREAVPPASRSTDSRGSMDGIRFADTDVSANRKVPASGAFHNLAWDSGIMAESHQCA
jgi:hypothetical protein